MDCCMFLPQIALLSYGKMSNTTKYKMLWNLCQAASFRSKTVYRLAFSCSAKVITNNSVTLLTKGPYNQEARNDH